VQTLQRNRMTSASDQTLHGTSPSQVKIAGSDTASRLLMSRELAPGKLSPTNLFPTKLSLTNLSKLKMD
jgi:hypothetical protein